MVNSSQNGKITTSKKKQKSRSSKTRRVILRGIPLSPGLAVGVVRRYRDTLTRQVQSEHISEPEVSGEIRRFRRALKEALRRTGVLEQRVKTQLDRSQSDIFGSHVMTLQDEGLIRDIEESIRSRKISSEAAVRDAFGRLEDSLRSSGSKLLLERIDDIRDLARLLYRCLAGKGMPRIHGREDPLVIMSRRILPSDIVHLNRKSVAGIVSEEGSTNAHAAILAREYSVPFVSNVSTALMRIPDGTPIIVDGDKGRVVLFPPSSELERARREKKRREESFQIMVSKTRKARVWFNDERVHVLANTFSPADVKLGRKLGAEGVGLFRLETTYMSVSEPPTEDELYSALNHALIPMRTCDLTIRLLDAGGDKSISYLPSTDENASPLGLRGIHLLFKHPEVLRAQIRAVLRLSSGFAVRILIPMVTTVDDVLRTRAVIEEETENLRGINLSVSNRIPLGAMIETPAALLTHEEIIKNSDFVSLGTNDLVQYTMAADREHADMFHYYQQGVRLIMPFLKPVIHRCAAVGKECVLCGELASDSDHTEALLRMGLRNFSVDPHAIPYLKQSMLSLMKKSGDHAKSRRHGRKRTNSPHKTGSFPDPAARV